MASTAKRALRNEPPPGDGLANREPFLTQLFIEVKTVLGRTYMTPKASIASATFLKPAMFAPFT